MDAIRITTGLVAMAAQRAVLGSPLSEDVCAKDEDAPVIEIPVPHIVHLSVENDSGEYETYYVPYQCIPKFMRNMVSDTYINPFECLIGIGAVVNRVAYSKDQEDEHARFLNTLDSKSLTCFGTCIKLSFLIVIP